MKQQKKPQHHSSLPPGNPGGLAVFIHNVCGWCGKRIGPRILQDQPDPSLCYTLLSFWLGLFGAPSKPGQLRQVGCIGTCSVLYFSELIVIHTQDKIFPNSLQVSQDKDKCLKETFTTQKRVNPQFKVTLQVLSMLWSPPCLWNDMIRLPCVTSSHLCIPQRA